MHSGLCDFQVSALCCDAFRKLFQQDQVGGASLAAVRVISGLTKSLSYNVRPQVGQHVRWGAFITVFITPGCSHSSAVACVVRVCVGGQVLRTLLSLRIKEVQVKKDLEDSRPQKKFMNNKDKKKNLSRMQRKV